MLLRVQTAVGTSGQHTVVLTTKVRGGNTVDVVFNQQLLIVVDDVQSHIPCIVDRFHFAWRNNGGGGGDVGGSVCE